MSDLSERAAAELTAIVRLYAAGEAEVVRAFFSQPRPIDDCVDVLLRQMGRELHTAHWLHRALRMLEGLDRTVDRHAFAEFLEQIAEETEHYVILADLAESVAGRSPTADELHRYKVYAFWDPEASAEQLFNPLLPEANRMIEVTRDVVSDLGYERGWQVIRLSEGGGGGAFIECTRLTGDSFHDQLAAAMRRIVKDEMKHGPERVEGFARTWVRDEADVEAATRWLRAVMVQHLRVRNEIWRYPLSPERLREIDAGDTQPFDETLGPDM